MEYREIAPARQLTPFVSTFWTLSGAVPDPSFELVLPDGHAELVIHRTGRFREWREPDKSVEQPAALVAVVMDRAIALAPAPRFETLGVRFTPLGLAPLCRVPQCAVSGHLLPAQDVLSLPLARIAEAARHADSIDQSLQLLQRGLIQCFDRAATVPKRLAAAVALIERSAGRASMDSLLEDTGATARWLERHFQTSVGLSPKRYARVVRFHRAVRALMAAPALSGAAVAADHGYYDQAHFTNEFKAFTGWAPGTFVSQQLGELTRHFASTDAAPR